MLSSYTQSVFKSTLGHHYIFILLVNIYQLGLYNYKHYHVFIRPALRFKSKDNFLLKQFLIMQLNLGLFEIIYMKCDT